MPAAVPPVRLGDTHEDGIAPSVFVLIERGSNRRPEIVSAMRGQVELRFHEPLEPVRIAFEADEIVVEDGAWEHPDLVIEGKLPHIIHLTTAPTVGGVPHPFAERGRAALSRIANRRIRITGNRGLGRRLLKLLEL